MEDYDREMEIIALLSNPDDSYNYVTCSEEVIEHTCEKTKETKSIELIEVEYFMDAGLRSDRANFCDQCNTVFIFRPQ